MYRRTAFFHTLLLLTACFLKILSKGRSMMNKQPRIAVFGGDSRQIFVAKRLMEDGFKVCAWGLGDKGRELLGDS
ncbi:MAG: hypothetical protein IJX19_11510, partial [Clostridia bacterium]|nr:hypothetical protein [Clostridia bacterium]